MNVRLAPKVFRAALIVSLLAGATSLWIFIQQSAATLAPPMEALTLPRGYQITTPASSPSIQFIDGNSYARLIRTRESGSALEWVDANTNEKTVIHTLEPALDRIPKDSKIFLWKLSPDLKRILLLGGASRLPIRLVASIETGDFTEFDGPPLDSTGDLINVGVTWAPDSSFWMEYTSGDTDKVTVYSLDESGPVRSGSGDAFEFAALNLVALNDRAFRAPYYDDDDPRVGVATWKIEDDGSVNPFEIQFAPFETYTEEGDGPQVDPILLNAQSDGQKWLVSDFSPRKTLTIVKSFPFIQTQTQRGRYEIWETQPNEEKARLIWRFTNVKPKFELSPSTDSQYLSFLDQRKFWTIPIDR